MEDLTKLDICEILRSLETGYDIITSNLEDEQTDFLGMGDAVVEENALLDLDLKLSLKDYLLSLRKED